MDEQCFVIDDDSKAEWALEKIKESTEERDRLLALVEEKKAALADQKQKILDKYESETSFLKFRLRDYMENVKVKSTKTQDTYQLLTGKLVRKHPSIDYKVDEGKLLAWLEDNNRSDLIKVERSPMWGELKKHLSGDVESGFVIMAESGEVIDGVVATEKPETFDIKF